MPERLESHQERAVSPAHRVLPEGDGGYFYPGEVCRMFGLQDIDYRQLRNLYELVRIQAGHPIPERGWGRYTLTDIAGIEVLLRLTRGALSVRTSTQFRLKPIASACMALRERGFDNPLLQVPMRREGDRIFAVVDSVVIEPTTGQLVMQRTADLVRDHLSGETFNQELDAMLNTELAAAPTQSVSLVPDNALQVT